MKPTKDQLVAYIGEIRIHLNSIPQDNTIPFAVEVLIDYMNFHENLGLSREISQEYFGVLPDWNEN